MKFIKKNRVFQRLVLAASTFFLVACTRTCVGVPELGSKQRPVRFYIDSWQRSDESIQSFNTMSACLEKESGYRVSFEIAADEKAVAAALGRSEAEFGFLSAMGYLDAAHKYPLQSLLVLSRKGEPSTRSAILGKISRWRSSLSPLGIPLTNSGLRSDLALNPISSGRFVYVSPESDVGFFVPRHILFQHNIFPEEAIFAGSFELVLQSIQREIGIAGAVSESFVEEKFPTAVPLQIGSFFGDFVVLALSQGLPGKVVTSRQGLPQKLTPAILSALDVCAKNPYRSEFERVFGGDGFYKSSDRMFDFLRELQDFQSEYVRVLSPQDP